MRREEGDLGTLALQDQNERQEELPSVANNHRLPKVHVEENSCPLYRKEDGWVRRTSHPHQLLGKEKEAKRD
jgi:hypothetical protein